MAEEFPALLEKITRLENTIAQLAAQAARHEEQAVQHAGAWTLDLFREDGGDAHWELASDGDFEWEGEGIRIVLRKAGR